MFVCIKLLFFFINSVIVISCYQPPAAPSIKKKIMKCTDQDIQSETIKKETITTILTNQHI